MSRILSFHLDMPKENFIDKLKSLWLDTDTFTKLTVIIGVIFALVTPVFIAQKTGLFIHAGSSVYSTCINPPAGFDQQELDLLSQTKHINWCKTLAQNFSEGQNASQESLHATPTPVVSNPISIMSEKVQIFLLSVRKLFTGQSTQ